MWPGRNHKETLQHAIIDTCGAIILFVFMVESSGDKYEKLIAAVSVIVITILLSLEWVRFIKQYVDFAIEEKLKERKIVEFAIQEKIKKLEEKE